MALLVALAALLAVGAVAGSALRRASEEAAWVSQAHEVQTNIAGVLATLSDAESARRGLVITGNPALGVQARRSSASLAPRVEALRTMLADDQHRRVDELAPVIRRWTELLQRSVDLTASGSDDAEEQRRITVEGVRHSTGIRGVLAEVRETQQARLRERAAAADATAARARRLLETGTVLALAVIGVTLVALWREAGSRREAEQALVDTEARLRDTLETVGVGAYQLDVRTGGLTLSPEARQLLGFAPDASLDMEKAVANIDPADRSVLAEAVRRSVEEGAELQMEYRVRRPDGQRRWIASHGRVATDDDGHLARLEGILTDVTDRHEADERLRAYAEEVRDLFDHAPCGYHTVDPDGRIQRINETELRWLGRSREEVLGRPFVELLASDSRADYQRAMQGLLEGRPVDALEVDAVGAGGRLLPLSLSATLQRGEGGQPVAVRCTVFDIRERREAERAQRVANRRLAAESRRAQEATRMKSEFLANMSHELRTPLNAVIGFGELLYDGKAGPLTDDQREYVGDILTSGRHLLQLINDVLDLAKVEAGRVDFRAEDVELGALFGEGRDLLRALAARKRLTVQVSADAAIGPVRLDPARLKQVLYNFLSNAIKFTPEEGHIRVGARPEGATFFRLSVEDTGVGIAAEDIPRLFEEFQQLDGGLGKRHQGTGLGLALTRRLVEAQGGRVGVTSEPGRGSTFFAVLPRQAEGVVGHARAVARRSAGVRVLVVEDDAQDRDWLVRELEQAGYSVDAVATGTEALARCRHEPYAAITLDLILPDGAGWEILKAVRADGPNRETPVVVLSVVSEREAGPALNVHDHLVKPVRTEDLLAALGSAGALPDREVLSDVHGVVLHAGAPADELVATLDRCASAEPVGERS